ncbi:endonuclease/exonuclease/phosphatase family protein [Amnibacterium flavum]|uniref:Endonuclease/exonuclease/phosphatase domain-containing protein n=1 Tax=Amnibacterium flavum TaxID=2173173 RepID=A0A2V1HNV6_9MICO|nr:endonuclease/exonuclease/phosphatase family protein [Amnibacterium flavum]PVZ94323.1 hypothetical protein DDQ50_11380 [Amnibacterium flavum]
MPGAAETRRPRVAAALAPLVVSTVAALVVGAIVWPQSVGLERFPLPVYLVSSRGLLLLALVLAAITTSVLASRSRARRSILVPIAVVLVLGAVFNGIVIAARGMGEPLAAVPADGGVRVLSWNTEHAAPGAEAIASLIREVEADVVMLPETDAEAAEAIAAELTASGLSAQHETVDHEGFPGSVPTSVVFVGELSSAGYQRAGAAGSTPGQPSAVWEPTNRDAPRVGAVHTVPPMPWAFPLWSAGLDWVVAQCADPRAVIAGDLNATLDHMAGLGVDGGTVGRCRDAAAESSSAARGTWPTNVPELLASPIDHILVGSDWEVVSFDVLTGASTSGSDHRPILAVLSPSGDFLE